MESEYAAPWKVVPQLSGSENHRGYRIAASDGYYFADVYPIDSDGIRGLNRARLIEAAPDLLEALKGVMEYAEIEVVQRRHLIDSDEEAAEVEDAQKKIAAAVAAIAKATGGDK